MVEKREYRVELDPEKVEVLSRVLGQQAPEKLVENLFELAYHNYVEEEDELVPGKLLKRKTQELEAQIEQLNRRLSAKSPPDTGQESVLCPKCFSKIRYDSLSRDYTCQRCGWEGPPEEVVRKPGTTATRS